MKLLQRACKALFVLAVFGFCFWWGRQVREVFYGTDVWQPRLLLDAGHGGEDGGAVSISGQKESVINLEITQKLDQVLAFLGEPALLLRETDISIYEDGAQTLREKKVSDLKHRVRIAGQYPGAILVSVHQNSYPEPQYCGTQVFYAPTGGSQQLAQRLQQAVVTHMQPKNTREAKIIPDSVYLMNHIRNTAVLIECGFLTNPEEEKLLQQEEYQRKLALVLGTTLVEELQ